MQNRYDEKDENRLQTEQYTRPEYNKNGAYFIEWFYLV